MVEGEANTNISETIKELMAINHIEKINLKDIKLKKKIGEGGQAKVYRGTYKGEEVAVKVLEEVDWKCLAHEIVIISNLHHSSIPKFYGIILEEGIIGLVNKYISGKPLDEYKIADFNEKQKLKIAKSLAESLCFIHENNFIHRDLKPENIMIDADFNFYLIDFGIAKVVTGENNAYTRAKGTVHYLAPETLEVAELNETEEIISSITTKVDVWAYGCILAYLFSEKLPWCNKYLDNSAVIQKLLIKKSEYPVPEDLIAKHNYESGELIVKIIKGCMVIDIKKRLTMRLVMELLEQNGI